MRVAITGSSGLIGRSLGSALLLRGDDVRPLRRPDDWRCDCFPDAASATVNLPSLHDADVLVHLAGQPIAAGRWTAHRRRLIHTSRVRSSAAFAQALVHMDPAHRPTAVICASGMHYALPCSTPQADDATIDESSPPGEGFLAEVCQAWEAAWQPAVDAGIRVVHARMSMVLDRDRGALPELARPMRWGLGGRLGNGRQFWSWITLHDAVRAILHAIDTPSIRGPMLVASPHPVRCRAFIATLGQVLHRPAWLPAPAWALRLAMGRDMADELILASIKGHPTVLAQTGFTWTAPMLEPALRQVLDKSSPAWSRDADISTGSRIE